MAQVTVAVRGADLVWSQLGTEQARGKWVEDVQLSSDEHGPLRASWTLHRNPRLPWPELAPFAPVEVFVDGVLVWAGRIGQSPFTLGGNEEAVNVECEGMQTFLDDDMNWNSYVVGNLAAFQDQRNMPWIAAAGGYAGWPSYFIPSATVTNGDGYVDLCFVKGQAIPLSGCVGVLLDIGPAANMVACSLILSGTGDANYLVYVRGGQVPDFTYNVGYVNFVSGVGLNTITPVNTQVTAGRYSTATASLRYLFVVLYSNAAQTPATDVHLRIHQVQAATNANYLPASGLTNPLVTNLHASDVVLDYTSFVANTSSDKSLITATSLAIPEYVPGRSLKPREAVEAMNAYHDYLYGIDEQRRIYFMPRPSAPLYEVGDWAGWTFTDASSGSTADIYNWCGVEGVGFDGQPFVAWRNRACPALDRYGWARSITLPVNSQMTAAIANSMADTFLASNAKTPFKGSINIQGQGGVRTVQGGQHMHPSQLLTECGQLMRLPLIDPDTGGWGRDVKIASVSYSHDTESADVQLDTDNARFQTLLDRMNLATASISPT